MKPRPIPDTYSGVKVMRRGLARLVACGTVCGAGCEATGIQRTIMAAVTEIRNPGREQDVPRWGWWLAVCLAGLLVVRLVALRFNGTDLFFDEAQYWTWSLEPAFGYYSKPPLIAWAIRLATGLCGSSEFCIRLPSPLFYTATAAVIFGLGTRLYDARVGFWSALVFATLPGVSLSAGIMSTDVPLLLFWALALYAFAGFLREPGWGHAVLLGAAIGLGLNAKYAMGFFVACAALFLALTPERRALLKDRRLGAALAIAGLLIAPNVIWNASNSFATLSHTADNAKWSGALFNPGKAMEFFGAQFGVFGPILFGALLVIVHRSWNRGIPAEDRLLLFFTVPIIVLITLQGLVSRAHANWAGFAYVAAAVLLTATMLRDVAWSWLKASFVLHLAVLLALVLGAVYAGKFRLPVAGDPYARTLGWKEIAAATREKLAEARRQGKPFASVITDERALTAELLYYMRDEPTPVLAWRDGGKPQDHYELKRPFEKGSPEPVLLVGLRNDIERVTGRFARVEPLGISEIPAGAGPMRRIRFLGLAGYQGR